jgi:hypothetical protein
MQAQRKDRRGDLIPVIVAAIVAVVGTGAILFNDFGPDNNSLGSGNGMITAAAVSRAGAIVIPSDLPAGRPVS